MLPIRQLLAVARRGRCSSSESTRSIPYLVRRESQHPQERPGFPISNKTLAENCDLFYKELDKGYENAIAEVNIQFDIILVDGRKRVACIKSAVDYLSEKGGLILDNSERKEHKEGIDFMLKKGFKKIDFYGIPPGLFVFSCTSVFYKSGNCLNI